MARQLSTYEIFDFYSRHADVKHLAGVFEDQVKRYGYTNFTTPGEGVREYVIPKWGMAREDAVYSWVTIFPDASGILHFTIDVAPPGDINKPAYESPNGGSFFQDIIDTANKATDAAGQAAATLPWIIGGVLLVLGLFLIADTRRA